MYKVKLILRVFFQPEGRGVWVRESNRSLGLIRACIFKTFFQLDTIFIISHCTYRYYIITMKGRNIFIWMYRRMMDFDFVVHFDFQDEFMDKSWTGTQSLCRWSKEGRLLCHARRTTSLTGKWGPCMMVQL